uniref:G-protein coupled receptors family 1 profile domain-containing protein n=1 Tax=Branchiostoma floridae TaxID=7739 RepID=C4A102_BRAFL|eukprot:XP_002585520.1 hypothetical protein BRAFLDRAFT_111923 [Branchiostoma floridae]
MANVSRLEQDLVPATFSLLTVFSVVGNLHVIFVILRCRRLRTRLNLFIVNIAVSDLIFTALYGPVSAVSVARSGGLRDHAVCVVTGIVGLLSCYESVLSAVLIALSRCVRITKSHRYDELFSHRSIMLPFAIIANAVIIVAYVLIYREVKASKARVHANGTDENQIPPVVLSQIKNMAAIYIAFNVCVTPEVIMDIFAYKTGESLRVLNLVARIVFTCNSCVNPIIYTAGNKEFRKELKALWGYVFCGCSKNKQTRVENINIKTPSLEGQGP